MCPVSLLPEYILKLHEQLGQLTSLLIRHSAPDSQLLPAYGLVAPSDRPTRKGSDPVLHILLCTSLLHAKGLAHI